MNTTAIVDIFCAVFIGILYARSFSNRNLSKSNRRLNLCLFLMIGSLLADAGAYTLVGPAYPLALRYFLNMISFTAACGNMIAFTYYTEALFTERAEIRPWYFRFLKILEYVWLICTVYEYIAGHLVSYDGGGWETVNFDYPDYIVILNMTVMLYLLLITWLNRQKIGREMAILLMLFDVIPVFTSLLYTVADIDLAFAIAAFTLALVAEFIQKKQTRQLMREQETNRELTKQQQALSDGLSREYHTVWLMDGFGEHNLHLYRSTGKTTVQSAVQLGLEQPCFDTSVVKYIRDNVLEEDQERVIEETRFETIARETPEVGTYVVSYRRYTLDRSDYTWHQMCFARAAGADGTINYILAYRDADRMMREQIAQQKQLQDALDTVRLEAKRNEVLIDAIKGGKFKYRISADDKITGAIYAEISQNRIGEDHLDKMEWIELLHPEDRDRVMASFMACVRDHSGKTPYDVTFRMKGTDGNYRWVRSGGKVIRQDDGSGEFYGISLDITAQMEEEARHEKQLEEALVRAKEESVRRKMIYQISDSSQWSYEIGADDTVLSVNYSDRLLSKMNARPSEDPMGWVRLVHPEERERVLAGFMAAIRDHGGNTTYDESYRIIDVNGDCRYVRSAGRVIRRADGTGEFVGMATDFTAQFREQEQQQKRLAEALSMADAANKAKTDFLFNMSHDIRTPMNAIIGFTNIAKKEIDNREKALDSLEKVQLSSEILLNLINDVLDMSRIESGKVELHEEKYELIEAYDSFEPAMANLAAAKDIDLKFTISAIRDKYVFVDGPRFDRVLINIISNAIKYTPAGGFVRVSADQIEDTKPGYGNYRFVVTDSGIGMSEEFQKHMFEDFTREENSTTSGVQGTGLGLSLAKKIVDLMGGSISCVSRQGVGTTFTVIFPFRLQTEADRAEERAAARDDVNIDLSGKRALLVEDNELNREIAAEILTDTGILVETAIDGQKAVNKVRERGADYYDFILMDIQMPVMDGYEAARAIHALLPDLKAPIIALSANAFEEDRKKSLEAGMNAHVAKPINIRELLNALSEFI